MVGLNVVAKRLRNPMTKTIEMGVSYVNGLRNVNFSEENKQRTLA
jgi:hypothetical protein